MQYILSCGLLLPENTWHGSCSHRRRQRWADKSYKKSHLGNEWKKPFAGSSHAKGIVLEKIGIEAKQPNSAIRKCARDEVLIAGFGRKGHAVGDIPEFDLRL
ncbi:40S ribosomal protein S23 [Glycine soja]|nr:40S ribosomal protein S23 [Glycine soja]